MSDPQRRTAADDIDTWMRGDAPGGAAVADAPETTEPTGETGDEAADLDVQDPSAGDEPTALFDDYGETDETDPDYKKRYVGSQRSYQSLKSKFEGLAEKSTRLELELQQLKADGARQRADVRPPPAPTDLTPDAVQIDRLLAELNAVPADAAEGTRRRAEIWDRHMRTMNEATLAQAQRVAEQTVERVAQEHEQKKRNFEEAKGQARQALAAIGLDQPEHLDMVIEKVNHLVQADPGWFQRIPESEHYTTLAEQVRQRVALLTKDRARDANERLQRQAGGALEGGRGPTRKTRADRKDDVPDRSFTAQILDDRAASVKHGNALFTRHAAAAG